MSGLQKATLQKVGADNKLQGAQIPVQFNPASLKLTLSNNVERGTTRGRPPRQFLGVDSAEVSFELIFDTADEAASGGRPRSVREKTWMVEQFLVPESQDKPAPPRAQFSWGDLVVTGIITRLTLEMDHFAADGTPLRAKIAISLQEQNPQQAIPHSDRAGKAPEPGQPGLGAVGSLGVSLGAQAALSIGGESAAEFSARVGLDPAAWRGLAGNLEGTLSLPAGLEIEFDASLSASTGIGSHQGVQAGVSASLEASFGLEVGASGSARSSGFALSAAGGVTAALETIRSARAEAAVARTREAFNVPAPSGPSSSGLCALPAPPPQPRPTLARTGLPSPSQQTLAPAAPPPPRADPRSLSFGYGIPLRPRRGLGDERGESVPWTRDPGAPPWTGLRASEGGRTAADARQGQLQPRHPCGCRGACSHPGGTPCP